MSASEARRLVLVVGVGRSGTSLLAGILGQLGLHVPQPEVQADETNPRGFGEPRWVVDFHHGLLRRLRVTVNDSRPAAWELTGATAQDAAVRETLRGWLAAELDRPEPVVVKDPRTVWFLPLWTQCARDLGAQVSFVTMLRHPAEIVTSARRSYGTWQTDASRVAAWLNVALETERSTRGDRRAFVRYEDLLADWAAEVRRVGRLIDVPALAAADPASSPEADAFVDPSLRRNRVGWEALEVSERVRSLADEAFPRLEALAAGGGDAPPAHAALDAAREDYRALYAEAEAIAQSSITAARPRKRRKQAPPPPGLRARLARRLRRRR